MTSRKSVATPAAQHAFHTAAGNISGTAESLQRRLKQLDTELKADRAGQKEFQDLLSKLRLEKADVEGRIAKNRSWIANFESNQDNGAFEEQYKALLVEIQQIYESAKEFHGRGIELLIRDFGYHIAFKRWNDSFTAVPFKPK